MPSRHGPRHRSRLYTAAHHRGPSRKVGGGNRRDETPTLNLCAVFYFAGGQCIGCAHAPVSHHLAPSRAFDRGIGPSRRYQSTSGDLSEPFCQIGFLSQAASQMTMGGLTFYGCLASQDHRSKARNRIVKSVFGLFFCARFQLLNKEK